MSSNLRVNSIVPATGTNVAIGTAGGTITYGASVAGVSTFTTLNATSITVAAGSTSSPSISPSGDSNTGIFFPSADSIAFGEGGSEALRIDSSGRVGLNTNIASGAFYNRLVINSPDNSCWMSLHSAQTGSVVNSDGIDIGLNGSNQGHFWLRENADLLIATNNTERVRIDSSGRVTKPYQPSFFAYVTTNDTTVANDTIIVFDGTAHNTGSHYSTSTGRFTAPVTGLYAFHAQIWAKNGSGFSRAIFRIAGSTATQNGFHPGTVGNANDHTFQMSMVRQVTAGDAVDVMTNLGPLTFYGGGASAPHTYFCGYLVG